MEINRVTQKEVPSETFNSQTMFPTNNRDADETLQIYKATTNRDTMYYHEAVQEPDKDYFKTAMHKEVNDQFDNGSFTVVPRDSVPGGSKIHHTVWQLKRKQQLATGQIKKHKARLNLDGSTVVKGKGYDHTYAPVSKWSSIRLLLTLKILHSWKTRQMDYVQTYPQAPIDMPMYMNIPPEFKLTGHKQYNNKDHALKIKNNIYGQKQSGRVWNQYLVKRLRKIGFTQSLYDPCVFYRGKVIYLIYTDDSILVAPTETLINKCIADIRKTGLQIMDEGNLNDFLGVHIEKQIDGTVKISKPTL